MTLNIPLRAVFQAGKTAFGLWNTLPGTALARTIASTPGISWVVIDTEHGQLNDTNIYEHANAIASQGVSPLVRIPVDDAWWIKRALDSGAHGLMVPLAHNASTVRNIVAASKYPPIGIRGFGPMYTHHAFGCSPAEYKEAADKNVLVIVQIESQQGLANVEEIAQVDDLDVLFIGPFDLSLSLGTAFGSDDHEAAIAKILDAAHKFGKKAAIYCTNGAQAAMRASQGFDMISVASDVDIISGAFTSHVKDAAGLEAQSGTGGAYNIS